MTRRSTSSSSQGKPASSHASFRSSRRERSKSAVTSASVSPVRTATGSAFSPSARRIASTRIDLPAPVSPVTTFRPGAKGTRTSSKIARSRTESSISIAGTESPLSPLELRAQDGEVILVGGAEEPQGGIRLLDLHHVPGPEPEPHLAVEREEYVGLLRTQLRAHDHVVRDDERPVREGVGTDRRDENGAQHRVDDGPLRGEGIPRRSGGRRDDEPVRLEGGQVHFSHGRLDVDDLGE